MRDWIARQVSRLFPMSETERESIEAVYLMAQLNIDVSHHEDEAHQAQDAVRLLARRDHRLHQWVKRMDARF